MVDSLSSSTAQPFISARGISKEFAGIDVLRDVDLDLMSGEIHALTANQINSAVPSRSPASQGEPA